MGNMLALARALSMMTMLGGCAITNLAQGDELLRQGSFERAAAAYQRARDPDADRVAFRQALLYAAPDSPHHDPEVAIQLLRGIVIGSGGGPYALAAEILLGLLEGNAALTHEVQVERAVARECTVQLARAREEAGETHQGLRERVERLTAELQRSNAEVERLRADRAELERLRAELDEMKRIDLDRR